ncbi:MAG TPA: cellulose synthase operon protein YhjQ/BcsQ [Bryobacteraceae bacterium]|nr:cellulose synthase operon protein YhjQ/BcsQ [Bryobacteraceae bacterium]
MRAILICPNELLRKQFEEAVVDSTVRIARTLNSYPPSEDLRRVVRAWAPEIVFLDIENESMAEAVAGQLEEEFPAVQRVALHPLQNAAVFRSVLRMHMGQLLSAPFDSVEVGQVLNQLQQDLETRPATINSTDRFFAFMPAKAGVGASTLAANATWAFSQPEGSNVLLADFDMASGVTGFMFDAEHDQNLVDAAVWGKEVDEEAWRRLVKTVGNIDLLLSGAPHVGEGLSQGQVAQLIEFARRNYNVVSADLPDTFDATTLTVLREANRIFLVTTPELSALRLARLKMLLLQRLELTDKVSLLVNRASARMELSVEEIEKTVGLKVFMSFPCDYADVTKAIRAGRPAPKLASSVRKFRELLDTKVRKEKAPRFIERFGIIPMRYGFR